MIRSMLLRDEDSDPMDNLGQTCWRLCLYLIAWAMAFFAAAGLWRSL